MKKINRVYQNSTELMNLNGVPFYMNDFGDACLYGRLNLFLQGDTGWGKTEFAKGMMQNFPDKTISLLGRNDMDTRELFQRINLGKLNAKPKYDLEPLINLETGITEYYYPVFENGKIVQKSEILDKDTLMKDKTPGISLEDWLENSTKQGLPKKNIDSGDLYYFYPRRDNNSVAWFYAVSAWAYLYCGRDPSCRSSSLGVRRIAQGEQ